MWLFAFPAIDPRQLLNWNAAVVATDHGLIDERRPQEPKLVPASGRRRNRGLANRNSPLLAKSPDQFEIFHNGQMLETAQSIKSVAAYEQCLIAVGQRKATRTQLHSPLYPPRSQFKRIDVEPKSASNDRLVRQRVSNMFEIVDR